MEKRQFLRSDWWHNCIVILILACLATLGQCSWLKQSTRKREGSSGYIASLVSSYRPCPPKQVQCWCGSDQDRRVTIVDAKQCAFPTSWGSLCEPCQAPEDTCALLQHCARCMPDNRHAICAQCPPDRHGLHCELERPCKTPNVSEHMTVHPHFTKKGVYKLEFRCSGGRVRHGPRYMKCNATSAKWNRDRPPKCVFPLRCSDLPNTTIPFTRVRHRSSDHVVLECDEGYVTSGKILQTTFQCEHGAWVQIGESVKCEQRGCLQLSVEAGNVRYSGDFNISESRFVTPGSRAKVTCQYGFLLQGSAEVNCSSSGRWEPSVPTCVARKCESVPQGKNCSLYTPSQNAVFLTDVSQVLPGQVVRMACKDGSFRRRGIGDKERICLYNGTLTGSDIVCKELVVCKIHESSHPHLRFCRVSGGNCIPGEDKYEDQTFEYPHNVVPLGAKARFGCDRHYQLDNSETTEQCLPQGSFKIPTCVPECGIRHPPKNELIAGGNESWIESWPWQAALLRMEAGRNGKEHAVLICGATLIYDRWALTAGHCVTNQSHPKEPMDKDQLRLVYGMSLTQDIASGAIQDDEFKGKFGVSNIIIHHHYDENTLDHDIALIELKRPVEINFQVGVACLPASLHCSERRLVKGKEGVVTGWGAGMNDRLSEKLRELKLFVANATECEIHYRDQGYNTDAWTENMFCAESNSTTQDTTDGDSGGPFVVQTDSKKWVLEGIVSWGLHKNDVNTRIKTRTRLPIDRDPLATLPCPGSVCYSGYTRVAKHLSWIKENTGRSTTTGCA